MLEIREILKDLIEEDIRKKEKARQGTRYYRVMNDIQKVDFRQYYNDNRLFIDYNKSNEKLSNGFHKKLVDQKVGYIAGKPIVFSAEDENLQKAVNDTLGEQANDIFSEWIKGASNRGWDGLHVYYNKNGEFKIINISNLELIFIYDESYENELENVIRYYEMEFVYDGKKQESLRVEVWDDEKVVFYQKIGEEYYFISEGTMGINQNPKFHWQNENTATNEIVSNGSWDRIPFIKLKNNTEEMTDLEPIKSYVDALDVVSSGFINDLKDLQLAIWVLRGYESESLSEFTHNLKTFKAIVLDADEKSSVDNITMEIPKEAREVLMKWLENKIYQIGQGVDESNITGSSITNVVIKAMYAGLDIKSNLLITKMKSALTELMYFVVMHINIKNKTNYNYKDVKFTFNKSMIFNTAEIIDMIQKSVGLVSRKTLLGQHPLVDNVEDELKQIELEEMESFTDIDESDVPDEAGV